MHGCGDIYWSVKELQIAISSIENDSLLTPVIHWQYLLSYVPIYDNLLRLIRISVDLILLRFSAGNRICYEFMTAIATACAEDSLRSTPLHPHSLNSSYKCSLNVGNAKVKTQVPFRAEHSTLRSELCPAVALPIHCCPVQREASLIRRRASQFDVCK